MTNTDAVVRMYVSKSLHFYYYRVRTLTELRICQVSTNPFLELASGKGRQQLPSFCRRLAECSVLLALFLHDCLLLGCREGSGGFGLGWCTAGEDRLNASHSLARSRA